MLNVLRRRSVGVFSLLVLPYVAWAGSAAAADATPVPASEATPAPTALVAPPVQDAKPKDSNGTLAPNSVYAEGLGAAFAYSINYERMFLDQLGVRVGVSYLSIGSGVSAGGTSASASATYLFVPITASYVGIRSGKSALELGGGVTLLYTSAAGNGAGFAASSSGVVPIGVLMAGYRLQPVDHAGFMFRAGVEALAANGLSLSNPEPNKIGFLPWPYVSLGASF